MSEIFQTFADGKFHFGACSVRVYDRRDVTTYGTDFLHKLYDASLASAPSRPYGILEEALCGFTDLTADAVCAYLHTRSPLLLMCVDKSDAQGGFEVIGFSFPTIWAGPAQGKIDPDPGRSMLMGYVIFRSAWRSPEAVVCMMLTGIYYFHQFNLLNIQGQRLPWNHLTAKFLAQFGTRDVGVLPKFLFDGKKMVDSIQSCLDRTLFEDYVRKVLAECSKPQPSVVLPS